MGLIFRKQVKSRASSAPNHLRYLLYANSTDGMAWTKPDLGRYDLATRWRKDPAVAKLGKHNNIVSPHTLASTTP